MNMNEFSQNLPKIFCLLFAGLCSVYSVDLPRAVLGVFQNERSSSAVAAELAVTNFNLKPSWHMNFSYKNYDLSLTMTEDDLVNKIIIAETPSFCQGIAEQLPESSFLICYSAPSFPSVFQNVYFSQPNPKAIAPALAYFIKYVDNYLATNRDCDKPIVTLILDNRNPNYPIPKDISSSLLALGTTVDTLYPEELHNISFDMSRVSIIVILPSTLNVAVNALMSLDSKMTSGFSVTVILLGVIKKRLLMNEISKNKFTTLDKFYFFACPAWNIDTTVYSKIRPELNFLTNQILDDDDDAPLVYDSVWAIIQAVDSSRVEIEMVESSGQSQNHNGIVMKKLREPTIGLSGEFSFDDNVRSLRNSVFKIYYSTKGNFSEIGKYYNCNNTISWEERLFEEDILCSSNMSRPHPENETSYQPNVPETNSAFRVTTTTKVLTLVYGLMSLIILMY